MVWFKYRILLNIIKFKMFMYCCNYSNDFVVFQLCLNVLFKFFFLFIFSNLLNQVFIFILSFIFFNENINLYNGKIYFCYNVGLIKYNVI